MKKLMIGLVLSLSATVSMANIDCSGPGVSVLGSGNNVVITLGDDTLNAKEIGEPDSDEISLESTDGKFKKAELVLDEYITIISRGAPKTYRFTSCN